MTCARTWRASSACASGAALRPRREAAPSVQAPSASSSPAAPVCEDDCSGERTNRFMVDEDAPDILRAIADRYLKINCSVMTPNDDRFAATLEMAEKYQVDGVIECVLTACHTFNVESARVERAVEGAGIPYMKVETDYSAGDMGQLETRVAAFIETL